MAKIAVLILSLFLFQSYSMSQNGAFTCSDTLFFPLWDLNICTDSTIEVRGSYSDNIAISFKEEVDSAHQNSSPVVIQAIYNRTGLDGKAIWKREVVTKLQQSEQIMVLVDTSFTLKDKSIYWNEANFRSPKGDYMLVCFAVVFVNNHYLTFRISGNPMKSNIRERLLESIKRCHFTETNLFEENYILQAQLTEDIVLAVQNEMRLKSILLDFDQFYASIPEEEKDEGSKEKLKGFIQEQQTMVKLLLRSMRKYEKIQISRMGFQPEKSSEKLTAFNSLIVLRCDDENVKLNVRSVKIDGEMFVMVMRPMK